MDNFNSVSWYLLNFFLFTFRRLSDVDQVNRAKAVAFFGSDPSELGCHGVPILWSTVEYISPNNVFLIPFGHSFLLGITKDLIKAIFAKPSQKGSAYILPSHLQISGTYAYVMAHNIPLEKR